MSLAAIETYHCHCYEIANVTSCFFSTHTFYLLGCDWSIELGLQIKKLRAYFLSLTSPNVKLGELNK